MAVRWNPCLVGMLVCDLRQFIKRYKSYTQTPAMLYLQNDTMSEIRLSKEKYFDIHANYTWKQCSILLLVKQTVMHKVVHHTIDKPYFLQGISWLCVLRQINEISEEKQNDVAAESKKCGKLV